MNYEETINRIHGFQKFGSRLGLERMAVLMDILGNPQDDMKVIHVAGTNGKGSVCRFLASMLKENGYRAGLYTSPYLERFTERIELDGIEISREDLADCASDVFNAVDIMLAEGCESPTEFELVTAIGFVYFSRKPIDILVLEVGLGGRGDSTNMIKAPLASVITSVSYDHMNVLGSTLEEIAAEKAGIIKEGCPVISNVEDPGAAAVIRRIAKEKGSFLYDAAQIQPQNIKKSLKGYSFEIKTGHNKPAGLFRAELGMIGMHQVSNAICALSVIEVLEDRGIISCKEENLRKGLKKAYNKGRFEILKESPLLIIDGAHNEAGVKALARVVKDHFRGKKLLLVIGMLADKEVGRLVQEFSAIEGDIVTAEPDNPRKLKSEELCRSVKCMGRECVALGDWESACAYIRNEIHKYDAVIVAGSLYLIGKIRGQFSNENEEGIADL